MREIKFRAFSTRIPFQGGRCEEMVYFGLTDLDEEFIISKGSYLDEDAFLMQFTGLHDKNGREIYEGDILKTECGNIGAIEWSDSMARFYFMVGDTGVIDDWESGEVIGNIYQNPNLLK